MPGELAVTDVVEVRCFTTFILNIFFVILSFSLFCFSLLDKTTEAKMMKAGGTEIGKTLAEKSRGLFSANDWQCKT